MKLHRLIRFGELIQRVPLSRSTIWRLEREGKFPSRKRLGVNAVGWLEAEVDQWISDKNLFGKVGGSAVRKEVQK